MSNKNIEDVYPVTSLQEGMLFHSQLAPESGVYVTQIGCTLKGLNVDAFERAWQRVLERHPILRTAFVWNNLEKPLQVVARKVKLPLALHDWRDLSPAEQAQGFQDQLIEDRRQGFKVTKPPLMRLSLFRIADDAYKFFWSHHHLLIDGWSGSVLLGEVFNFYEAYRSGQEIELPLPCPYRDYLAWLQKRSLSEAEAYWRRALKGFSTPTVIDLGQRDDASARQSPAPGSRRALLSRSATAALKNLTRERQLTMNTVVAGAWALLLSAYGGERDVAFGATSSGRPPELPGVESMIGLFINTLPVRVQVRPEATVLSWLENLQSQLAEMRQYEHSPLVEVQGWSDVPRGTALFESILVFENYPVAESLGAREWSVEIDEVNAVEKTNYPLTLGVAPGQQLSLQLIYDGNRFDEAAIERMLSHLTNLLGAISADLNQRISSLNLLSDMERRRLLGPWSNTGIDYSRSVSFFELLERQVKRTPDKVAAVFGNNVLTFNQLNDKAGKLAELIKELR